jgi:hypothetical protein
VGPGHDGRGLAGLVAALVRPTPAMIMEKMRPGTPDGLIFAMINMGGG